MFLERLNYKFIWNTRFQVPEYQNMQKFQNRIVSNLIYYQTNYGISALGIFGLITFMNPFKMSVGILTMALIFGLLYYLDASQIQVKKVKKDHPTLVMLGTFLAAYFFIHLVSSNRKINDASIKHFRDQGKNFRVWYFQRILTCLKQSFRFIVHHKSEKLHQTGSYLLLGLLKAYYLPPHLNELCIENILEWSLYFNW